MKSLTEKKKLPGKDVSDWDTMFMFLGAFFYAHDTRVHSKEEG